MSRIYNDLVKVLYEHIGDVSPALKQSIREVLNQDLQDTNERETQRESKWINLTDNSEEGMRLTQDISLALRFEADHLEAVKSIRKKIYSLVCKNAHEELIAPEYFTIPAISSLNVRTGYLEQFLKMLSHQESSSAAKENDLIEIEYAEPTSFTTQKANKVTVVKCDLVCQMDSLASELSELYHWSYHEAFSFIICGLTPRAVLFRAKFKEFHPSGVSRLLIEVDPRTPSDTLLSLYNEISFGITKVDGLNDKRYRKSKGKSESRKRMRIYGDTLGVESRAYIWSLAKPSYELIFASDNHPNSRPQDIISRLVFPSYCMPKPKSDQLEKENDVIDEVENWVKNVAALNDINWSSLTNINNYHVAGKLWRELHGIVQQRQIESRDDLIKYLDQSDEASFLNTLHEMYPLGVVCLSQYQKLEGTWKEKAEKLLQSNDERRLVNLDSYKFSTLFDHLSAPLRALVYDHLDRKI